MLQKEKGKVENCNQDCKTYELQNEHQMERAQVENIRLEQIQSKLQDETIDFGITGKDKVRTRARRGKTSDGEARKGGDTRGTT